MIKFQLFAIFFVALVSCSPGSNSLKSESGPSDGGSGQETSVDWQCTKGPVCCKDGVYAGEAHCKGPSSWQCPIGTEPANSCPKSRERQEELPDQEGKHPDKNRVMDIIHPEKQSLPTFDCGELQCKVGSEYCYTIGGRDPGTHHFECIPIPKNCNACKCIAVEHRKKHMGRVWSCDMCDTDSNGNYRIDCPGS